MIAAEPRVVGTGRVGRSRLIAPCLAAVVATFCGAGCVKPAPGAGGNADAAATLPGEGAFTARGRGAEKPAAGARGTGTGSATGTGEATDRSGAAPAPPGRARPTIRVDAPAATASGIGAREYRGIRTYWWVVTDDGAVGAGRQPVGSVFGPYAKNPVPVADPQRELWRRNGLRLVSVPVEDLGAVLSRLLVAGARQEQTHGELAEWSVVAAGASWGTTDGGGRGGGVGAAVIQLDNGPLELIAGRLRLLARCWIGPGVPSRTWSGVPAVLHLELLPQHQEFRPNKDLFDAAARSLPAIVDQARHSTDAGAGSEPVPAGEGRSRAEGDISRDRREDGLVFTRLALSLRMDPDRALVIVPEAPGVEWAAQPASPDQSTPARTGDGAAAGSAGAEEPPIVADGPAFPSLATLGEAMLTDRFSASAGRKLIVVIVPSVPERFDLLAR